jgi:hypothetical protein
LKKMINAKRIIPTRMIVNADPAGNAANMAISFHR